MDDDSLWKLIESFQWKKDHDYDRIARELKTYPSYVRVLLEKFIKERYRELYNTYIERLFGGVSDAISDITYDIIGRGKDFFNNMDDEQYIEMRENYTLDIESFIYIFYMSDDESESEGEFENKV